MVWQSALTAFKILRYHKYSEGSNSDRVLRWPFSKKRLLFQNWFVLNELRKIQLQFATNIIKIGQLKQEVQPAKGCETSLSWGYDVTWRHSPAAKNNIICHNFYLFMSVEVHLQDTQEISDAQLPYRRCERTMFVIYSSAHQLCVMPIILEHGFCL